MHIDWWFIGYAGVMVCWCAFAAVFAFRKRPPKAEAAAGKRDMTAYAAIFLQAVGYAIAWMSFRRDRSPLINEALAPLFSIAAIGLAVASVCLVLSSVRTLGKQWAVAARVVEGHQLITSGPYSSMRNPIYTGMFGMLLATGLAVSRWPQLIAAIVVFLIGTMWRISIEEKLLHAEFREQFDAYRKRVPALLPRIPR
jgi:protein-S-isoprenylcysteine O-methyltransferase Ste14